MKIRNFLMPLMCIVAVVGCRSSSNSDDKDSLFHAVSTESHYFNKLLESTYSTNQNYDGEEKFFELLSYWQSVISLRDYMVQAKSTLTNQDVESLIESVKSVAPSRNVKIVLNAMAKEYMEEAKLIRADLYKMIDLIEADYNELTQDTIELNNFEIILAGKEQIVQFFNDEFCRPGNLRGEIQGIVTQAKCDNLTYAIDRYLGIMAISVNGVCTNLRNPLGQDEVLDLESACFTRVIHNNIADTDTSFEEPALNALASASLYKFYNKEFCSPGNLEVKMIVPTEYEACGYIEYQRFNMGLYNRVSSQSSGKTCTNYRRENNYDDNMSFKSACEILYTQEVYGF